VIRVLVIGAAAEELRELVSEEARFEVVASVRDHPDVVVLAGSEMDAGVPKGIPVVVLNDDSDDALDLSAKTLARLPFRATPGEVCAAIEAAAQNLVVLTLPQAEAWLPAAPEPLIEAVTPRETQVLRMMALGLSNKEIAEKLQISEHTVKFHVASILGKLQARSRTEAVTVGIRRGLVFI
jgi:DNA-binding NarL/FixJ family response regulator